MYKPLRLSYWAITFCYFLFFVYEIITNFGNLKPFLVLNNHLVTYFLAFFGGLIAIENFYRKEGHSIKGKVTNTIYFGERSSTFDTSFTNLILFNLKDKPVIIFDIYINISKHTFVHLKKFDKESPLVIKGYESYYQKLPSAYFYDYNSNAYSLNKIDLTREFRIVLNTSDGMYKVKKIKNTNEYLMFYARVLKPIFLSLIPENESIPLNTSLIIQFKDLKNNYHQIFIKENFYWIKIEDYLIESENILTLEFLKSELAKGIESGKLKISTYKIIDFKKELLKIKSNYLQFSENHELLTLKNSHDSKQLRNLRAKILLRKIYRLKTKLIKVYKKP